MAKLGEICEKKIDTINSNYAGIIDYIDISSVDNQKKTITDTQRISFENAPSRAKQLVIPGDILVSTVRPNLNAVALVTEATDNVLIASTGYCVLRCLPSVDNKYVFYFCQSSAFVDKLVGQATGASYPAVTSSIVKQCSIPLPDLEEQRHIAAVLDKVTDLIAKRRAQLDKLDLLVKSRFVEVFGDPVGNPYGWDTVELKDIGTFKNGMNFHMDDCGVKIHCLGVADFKDYSFITNTSQLSVISLNETPAEEYLLKNGDIVFVRSNGNKALVGRSVLVYPEDTLTTFSGFCIRFRLQREFICPIYLLRVLKTDSIRGRLAGRGANIQNLNQKILSELIVPVPPLDLQVAFENFEKQVMSLQSVARQSVTRLEMLKKSLMQQYFCNEECPKK